jgi:hypothetical protein
VERGNAGEFIFNRQPGLTGKDQRLGLWPFGFGDSIDGAGETCIALNRCSANAKFFG